MWLKLTYEDIETQELRTATGKLKRHDPCSIDEELRAFACDTCEYLRDHKKKW